MHSTRQNTFFGSLLGHCDSSHFSAVLARFQPHEKLPRHSHETAYVSVVLKGSYRECWEHSSSECATDGVTFHPPGESHSDCFYAQGAQVLSLQIGPDFFYQLTDAGVHMKERATFRSSHCLQLASNLYNEMNRPADAASALAVEGLSLEVMAEMMRQRTTELLQKKPHWIERVRDIVNDHYREPLTLAELSATANVHPVHLARVFRSHYNCCIGDYVRKLRLTAASHELLHSSLPIAEIASRHGFADQAHLSRTLKQHTGLSPREFRKVRPAIPA